MKAIVLLCGLIVTAGLSAGFAAEKPAAQKQEEAKPLGVTAAGFAAIKTGMSYDSVVRILGKQGEEMSSSEIAGHTTIMYQWKGSGLGNMNAMFQNGKLITKAQFGLK